MPTVTATQVITDAFGDLNVIQLGEGLSSLSDGGTDALRRLNLMVGEWANNNLTIPAVSRIVFSLIANKGSSTNPYTIGPGGDINIARPTSQNHLVGAGLLYGSPAAPFDLEIPRGVATNEGWASERLKDLPNVIFTWVYYRPDFASGVGSLFLWPVPTDLTNSGVLYIEQALGTFADLTTQYSVPDGYDEALHLNLAFKLARPYGRMTVQERAMLQQDAMNALAAIKRANVKLTDQENDFAAIGTGSKRGLYNLLTGEGG